LVPDLRPSGRAARPAAASAASTDVFATQEIDMKARFIALVVAAAFCTPVLAEENVVAALAIETGMSTRDVRMVLGARSGHAEYLASYDQTTRRFVRAIGSARYRDLMAGRRVPLLHPEQRVASIALARD
jgi:hypothetical protein